VLTRKDGRTLERHVAHNLGTPDNPMSDQQLADKLVGLATPVLGSARADEIVAACWRLTELSDFRAVPDLTVPDGSE
jgi:2-methylcitrate dehydratase PrpD